MYFILICIGLLPSEEDVSCDCGILERLYTIKFVQLN